MANILIVYGTTEGQTAKISETIARTLRERGHQVQLFPAASAPTEKALEEYDGMILGSSVHTGSFNKAVRTWAKQNFILLQRKPSAFFSVCLGILEKDFKSKREERQIVEDFFRETGWNPALNTIFAGALTYSKYGWFKKRLMKAIAKNAGGGTDTSRDYEYTDWDNVQAFAQRFDTLVEKSGTNRALEMRKH